MSDKAMDFAQFVYEWTKAVQQDDTNRFLQFRWDYANLGAYVLDHAYTLWMAHYDKWDTVAAFAINYVQTIELHVSSKAGILAKWAEHGTMVRYLIVGG